MISGSRNCLRSLLPTWKHGFPQISPVSPNYGSPKCHTSTWASFPISFLHSININNKQINNFLQLSDTRIQTELILERNPQDLKHRPYLPKHDYVTSLESIQQLAQAKKTRIGLKFIATYSPVLQIASKSQMGSNKSLCDALGQAWYLGKGLCWESQH